MMMDEHDWAILGQGIVLMLAALGAGTIGYCIGKVVR